MVVPTTSAFLSFMFIDKEGVFRSRITDNVNNFATVPWGYCNPNWACSLRVLSLNPSPTTLLTCKASLIVLTHILVWD